MDGGGVLTADGADSVRGRALQTGDKSGYLEIPASGNVDSEAGTIELWIKLGNWSRGAARN
jgi:hypothetical protein